MSRSYKQAYIKDKPYRAKQFHARRYRRHVRQQIRIYFQSVAFLNTGGEFDWNEDLRCWWPDDRILDGHDGEPSFKHPYQITHPYDIMDYWCGPWVYDPCKPEDKPCGGYWFYDRGVRYLRK